MDKRLTWAGGAVLVIALVYWLFQEGAVEASDVQRPLSSARFDQNPFGVEMPVSGSVPANPVITFNNSDKSKTVNRCLH